MRGGVSGRLIASAMRSAGLRHGQALAKPCISTTSCPRSPAFVPPSSVNKLQLHNELMPSHNGIFKPWIVGHRSFLRCMRTAGQSEVSSAQESTVASPEIEMPQHVKFKRLDKTAKHIMNVNKSQLHNELMSSPNGIFKPWIVGHRSFLRCMTTAGQSEVSSAQESTVASPEIEMPQRVKFKRLDKTAKHIMNILDKEEVDKVRSDRQIPDIRPGYIIQLKVEVPENKRRTSTLKGIVIARRNAGLNTTFRLRRMVSNVGVESVFHLYSPNIKEIKVLDKKKVRRAKLYYLRDRMNPLKK